MSDLDDLRALAPPPGDPPGAIDWGAAGTELPPDFVELAELYGAGTFDDGVAILVPGHAKRCLRPRAPGRGSALGAALPARRGLRAAARPRELLPWGIDEGGNVLWWRMEGGPASWPVVANEARGDEWQSFPGGAVACLAALLSGRERVRLHRRRRGADEVPARCVAPSLRRRPSRRWSRAAGAAIRRPKTSGALES